MQAFTVPVMEYFLHLLVSAFTLLNHLSSSSSSDCTLCNKYLIYGVKYLCICDTVCGKDIYKNLSHLVQLSTSRQREVCVMNTLQCHGNSREELMNKAWFWFNYLSE